MLLTKSNALDAETGVGVVARAKAQATEAILREIAQQSEFNKRVYDSFVNYRMAAARYAEVSDLAQHQARQQVLS
jgi:hypothetical protein